MNCVEPIGYGYGLGENLRLPFRGGPVRVESSCHSDLFPPLETYSFR